MIPRGLVTSARASLALAASALAIASASALVWPVSMNAAGVTAEDGKRAYDAKNFTDAFGIWAKLSAEGNAAAAYGLGLLYDLGNGVPESQSDAFRWYSVAAMDGLPEAELNVAIMYDSGRGVARSQEDAAIWYGKAAAHNVARAQYNLGLLYANGEGVPRNPDVAKVWFTAALRNGVPAAAQQLKRLPQQTAPATSSTLTPVRLEAPQRNVVATAAKDGRAIELVWTAPPQPTESRFVLRVWTFKDDVMTLFYSASLSQTSSLLNVTNQPAFYAWSVEVVETQGSGKAGGEWSWFSVKAADPPASTATARARP